MKSNRNLYKKDINMGYEGNTDLALRNEMKRRGYKVGVWVTQNQLLGNNYVFGQLSLKSNAQPTIVEKFDFRTNTMHTLKLYNVEQTNLPEKHPGTYQHMVDEYAETYAELHKGWSLRSLAALF